MKYRIYIDEVGNSDMNSSLDSTNRFLSLTGVILDLEYVKESLHPEMEALKIKYFGNHPDEPIIFHRKEMMHKKHPFHVLKNESVNLEFERELLDLLRKWQFRIITVVIDKREHKNRYAIWRYDPYHYAMSILFERFHLRLKEIQQKGDMMFESRGGKEDIRLKESYRKIFAEGTEYIKPEDIDDTLTSKELKIKPKSANISGLQLADLLAYPCHRHVLRSHSLLNDGRETFSEKIMEVIESKYFRKGLQVEGYGIKLLP
jgi:hypothetical protein